MRRSLTFVSLSFVLIASERAAVRAVMEAMRRDPPAAFLVTKPIVRGVRSTWHMPDEGREISLSVDRWTLDPPCRS